MKLVYEDDSIRVLRDDCDKDRFVGIIVFRNKSLTLESLNLSNLNVKSFCSEGRAFNVLIDTSSINFASPDLIKRQSEAVKDLENDSTIVQAQRVAIFTNPLASVFVKSLFKMTGKKDTTKVFTDSKEAWNYVKFD